MIQREPCCWKWHSSSNYISILGSTTSRLSFFMRNYLCRSVYVLILETNGILIGNDTTYAEELSRFPNLYVRVSLKSACEEEFSKLTGAIPTGFQLQLNALEYLNKCGVNDGGILYSLIYGEVSFMSINPIEKNRYSIFILGAGGFPSEALGTTSDALDARIGI